MDSSRIRFNRSELNAQMKFSARFEQETDTLESAQAGIEVGTPRLRRKSRLVRKSRDSIFRYRDVRLAIELGVSRQAWVHSNCTLGRMNRTIVSLLVSWSPQYPRNSSKLTREFPIEIQRHSSQLKKLSWYERPIRRDVQKHPKYSCAGSHHRLA